MASEPRPESRYDLCIGDGRHRFAFAEATLTLSDEGISYRLDERSGLRRFDTLRSVRIQAIVAGRNSPWESATELVFERGRPLLVVSSGRFGGDDEARDRSYVAFLQDLHARIPQELRGSISFKRGVSPGRHKVLVAAFVAIVLIFGGAGLFLFHILASGRGSAWEILPALAGVLAFGYWGYQAMEKGRPSPYDPDHLPRDLFPE